MMQTTELIRSLADELQPVRPITQLGRRTLIWTTASVLLVIGLLLFTGYFRPGFAAQLVQSPRFLGETLLGVAVVVFASYSALCLGIPGARLFAASPFIPLVLLLLWAAVMFHGISSPALEPSMAGKRPYCFYETLLYGMAPYLMIFWLLRRAATFERGRAGLLMGVAACTVPAFLMHLACMYTPQHVLSHHLLPIPIVAVAGAVLARFFLPKI